VVGRFVYNFPTRFGILKIIKKIKEINLAIVSVIVHRLGFIYYKVSKTDTLFFLCLKWEKL